MQAVFSNVTWGQFSGQFWGHFWTKKILLNCHPDFSPAQVCRVLVVHQVADDDVGYLALLPGAGRQVLGRPSLPLPLHLGKEEVLVLLYDGLQLALGAGLLSIGNTDLRSKSFY